jgi:hypothetical protein
MKRETRITVTFTHPFQLKGIDRTLPPGDYTILTEEELTNGHLEKFLSPSLCESDSLTARGNGRMEEASHGAEGLFRC